VYGLSLDNRLAKGVSFAVDRNLPHNNLYSRKIDENQVDKHFEAID